MSDIGPLGMGSTVDVLSNAMTGASVEHDALANNIANVNTPGYRRQSVSFKDALAAASGDASDGDELQMIATDDRHFGADSAATIAPFDPKPQADPTLQMRVDKSNVDVDQEMAQLSQNSTYGQTMAQLLQVQFMRLREAVTEHPG
jgi:flagellar basal-body rod protein FlgB